MIKQQDCVHESMTLFHANVCTRTPIIFQISLCNWDNDKTPLTEHITVHSITHLKHFLKIQVTTYMVQWWIENKTIFVNSWSVSCRKARWFYSAHARNNTHRNEILLSPTSRLHITKINLISSHPMPPRSLSSVFLPYLFLMPSVAKCLHNDKCPI